MLYDTVAPHTISFHRSLVISITEKTCSWLYMILVFSLVPRAALLGGLQYLQLSLQLDTVVLLSFHLRPDMALLSLLLVLAPMFIFTVTLDLHPSVLHLPTYTPSPEQIQYILVANRLVAVQGGLMLILIVTLDVHPGVVHLATNTPSSGLDQCILSSKKLFLGRSKNMFAKFPIEISTDNWLKWTEFIFKTSKSQKRISICISMWSKCKL